MCWLLKIKWFCNAQNDLKLDVGYDKPLPFSQLKYDLGFLLHYDDEWHDYTIQLSF